MHGRTPSRFTPAPAGAADSRREPSPAALSTARFTPSKPTTWEPTGRARPRDARTHADAADHRDDPPVATGERLQQVCLHAHATTRRPRASARRCGPVDRRRRVRPAPTAAGADGASATAGAAVAALRSRTAARRSQPLTTVGVEGRSRRNPDPAPRRPSPRAGRSSPVSLIVTAGIAISGGRPG